jgi:hypothetical protein
VIKEVDTKWKSPGFFKMKLGRSQVSERDVGDGT